MNLFGKKKITLTPCTSPEEENAPILILGGGCANCNRLEANTKEAMAQLGFSDAVGHVTDFTKIAQYGVMRTPALVVDGKVVSSGQVLSVADAKELIQKARGNT